MIIQKKEFKMSRHNVNVSVESLINLAKGGKSSKESGEKSSKS